MGKFVMVLATVAIGVATPVVAADAPPKPTEAGIPFINHGGIHDWRAIDRQTLYIQDIHRHWYRATMLGDCIDLDFANAIGFDAGPTDTLDRFSAIIVRGQRCPLSSLTASGPPPKTSKKR